MTTWTQFCPVLTTTYIHVDIFKLKHGQKLAFLGPPITSSCPHSPPQFDFISYNFVALNNLSGSLPPTKNKKSTLM